MAQEDTVLAYTAGIIDGEGNIGIYANNSNGNPVYRMRVRVSNTNTKIIFWLKDLYGGSTGVNKVKSGHNWKPAWYWTISCNTALGFLEQIYPYLILKKEQAEIAIRYQKSKRKRLGRKFNESELAVGQAERILMQKLNKRGVI
jgi:hypothetical protein